MLAASGYATPSREEALRERVPLSRHPAAPWAGLALVASGVDVLAGYRPLSAEGLALRRLELQRIEIITGEPPVECVAAAPCDPPAVGWQRRRDHRRAPRSAGLALHPGFAPPRAAIGDAA